MSAVPDLRCFADLGGFPGFLYGLAGALPGPGAVGRATAGEAVFRKRSKRRRGGNRYEVGDQRALQQFDEGVAHPVRRGIASGVIRSNTCDSLAAILVRSLSRARFATVLLRHHAFS